METLWWYYLVIAAVAYFGGSVNFAKLFSRLKKKDISNEGSGNPGTMNMLRSVGIGLGLLTLFFDILKGALIAGFGVWLGGEIGLYTAGILCVIGHNYSIFLRLKGGKGVACCIGIFAVANPLATGIAFIGLLVYLFTFKYGSIGSFLLLIGLSITEGIIHRGTPEVVLLIALLASLIMFAHRGNIYRLIMGTENKLELVKLIKRAKEKSATKKLALAVAQEENAKNEESNAISAENTSASDIGDALTSQDSLQADEKKISQEKATGNK